MDIDVAESAFDHVVDEVSPEFPNGGARVISEALASAEPDRARLRESADDLGDAEAKASVNLPLESDSRNLTAKGASAPVVDQPAMQAPPAATPMDDLFGDAPFTPTRKNSGGSLTGASNAEETSATLVDEANDTKDARRNNPQLEELLILGVMAKPEAPFDGAALIAALRGQGLKYGDMGIFHRLGAGKVAGKNASEERLFSVANAIEPGTFDLSDLEGLQSPGLTFFMQLPIPGDALETLDDMVL